MAKKENVLTKTKKFLAVTSKKLKNKKWKKQVLRPSAKEAREKREKELSMLSQKADKKIRNRDMRSDRKQKEIITKKVA